MTKAFRTSQRTGVILRKKRRSTGHACAQQLSRLVVHPVEYPLRFCFWVRMQTIWVLSGPFKMLCESYSQMLQHNIFRLRYNRGGRIVTSSHSTWPREVLPNLPNALKKPPQVAESLLTVRRTASHQRIFYSIKSQ